MSTQTARIKYRVQNMTLTPKIEQVTMSDVQPVIAWPFTVYDSYFDTWEEARAVLVTRARKNFDAAVKEMESSRELLLRVENLSKPEPGAAAP